MEAHAFSTRALEHQASCQQTVQARMKEEDALYSSSRVDPYGYLSKITAVFWNNPG